MSPVLCLDPSAMRLDADGVADFRWPLPLHEVIGFRDHLLRELAMQLGALARRGGMEADLLRIAAPGLLYRAMSLFEAASVARAVAEQGAEVTLPASDVTLGPLLRGQEPRDFRFDPRSRLRQPFPVEPRLRSVMRCVRNRFSRAPLPRRSVWEVDTDRQIVCVTLERAALHHAEVVSEPVVYCHPRDWLSVGPSWSASVQQQGLAAEALDDTMNAVVKAASVHGLIMPGQALRYLRGYLDELTALARAHFERLVARPNRLPGRLWVVSGVSPWARVLGLAVQQSGGSVTGHEHGTGESWSDACGDSLFELDSLDRFVAYTPGSAAGLRQLRSTCPPGWPLRGEIEGLPASGSVPARDRRRAKRDGKPRALVVNTLYRGDLMRFKPPVADIVAADWQARLFGWLARSGYEPLFRPHPEDRVAPPCGFAEVLGVKTLTGPLDAALSQVDVVIFDYPLTSAWRDALDSDLPMVLVDFGQCPVSPEARRLLDGRVAVVQACFDNANRAQVDWDQLGKALQRAPDLDDGQFYETFFGAHA